MYHNFSIDSATDGQLRWFHFLPIISCTAIRKNVPVYWSRCWILHVGTLYSIPSCQFTSIILSPIHCTDKESKLRLNHSLKSITNGETKASIENGLDSRLHCHTSLCGDRWLACSYPRVMDSLRDKPWVWSPHAHWSAYSLMSYL